MAGRKKKKIKKIRRLPGFWTRLLSLFPGLNWIALIWIGICCSSIRCVLGGIFLGALLLWEPGTWSFVWTLSMFAYGMKHGLAKLEWEEQQIKAKKQMEMQDRRRKRKQTSKQKESVKEEKENLKKEKEEKQLEKSKEKQQKIRTETSSRSCSDTENSSLPENPPKPKITLDFTRIHTLRQQSDAVRDALAVPEEETLTAAATLLDTTTASATTMETAAIIETVTTTKNKLLTMLQAMDPVQQKVIGIVLRQKEIIPQLEQMAEELMTMPELMIDEINEVASRCLDDILIDTLEEEPGILSQYVPILQKFYNRQEEK